MWKTKSAGLDSSIEIVKKAEKRFLSIRNFEFKLNASMHQFGRMPVLEEARTMDIT